MTSVPKPLKFLRPHYAELKGIYYSWGSTEDHERAVKEDERTEKEAKQARAEEKKREVAPAATGTATPTAGPSTGGGPQTNGTDTPATPNGDAAAKSKPADLGKVAALAAAAAASNLAPSAISKSSEPAPARPLPKPGSVKGVPPADRSLLADIISVLAMTYSDSGKRETLAFRLRGHRGDAAKGIEGEDPGLWGHEYVRHLAAEIGEAFQAGSSREDEHAAKAADGDDATMKDDTMLQDRADEVEELQLLTMRIVPFLLNHNAETDAVDLLLELEAIEDIVPLVAERELLDALSMLETC